MRTDVIDSVEGLRRLGPEWKELYRRCPRATPFQSPQWLLPWTEHLYHGGDIWGLAVRDGRELVGFAPLFCWGTQRRSVSFLGAGISDYGDLLFAPEREGDCVAAVWEFLKGRRDTWDVLDLEELRGGSGLLEGAIAEECSVCPVLDLRTYPGAMDDKHRTDIRRAQNKLMQHAGLEFEVANETNFREQMAEFFRLYGARWGDMDEPVQGFHGEVAEGFAKAGLLRLYALRIDGVTAAAIYAFVTGSSLYCYLSGFDPAMAKLSPGAVLLNWVIEQAIAEGMREIDFLRQPEAYKYLWGARDRVTYKLVGKPGLVSAAKD